MGTSQVVADHRTACEGFSAVVHKVGSKWNAPSPCGEWDARAVLEHVIGFHDVLLLRPLDAKPARSKDDPVARWRVTVEAVFTALTRPDVVNVERALLLGVLTSEVLVHTWDLARAIGVNVTLDARLCEIGLERASANADNLAASEMFGPQVEVHGDAPIQNRLVATFGRDPQWSVAPRH